MTAPRWLISARQIRDDLLETNAAIRQILGDRASRASFEGNVIERIQLGELEKERGRLSWRLIQKLARGAGLDPYAVDEVTRRRMLFNFLGTGTTSSTGGGDATPASMSIAGALLLESDAEGLALLLEDA